MAVKGLSGGTPSVQLLNSNGVVLASGLAGPTNVDKVLADFTTVAAGTYYLVVTAPIGTTYSAIVTKNAEFNSEANNTIAQAQDLISRQVAGDQWALGHVGASGDSVDLYKI